MARHPHKARRRKREHRSPPGSPPGTISPPPSEPPPRIELIGYGPEGLAEHPIADPRQIPGLRAGHAVAWVNVEGLGHAPTLAALGETLGLHALSLEDAVSAHQRPKVEDYGGYLFVVVRMPRSVEPFETEQVSIFLGRDFVVTFQEHDRPGDTFEPVRQRLRQGVGRIRSLGADHLAYSLIDTVIDAYFPLLETLGDRLDALEDEVLASPEAPVARAVHAVKRDLSGIRRVAWPLRDAMNALLRDPAPLIAPETRVYLRDCYDHTVQIIDLLESYRELGSGLMELYLSGVSTRMNQVIKVLTVISTIFIPLTFIAGVYGMNFDPDASRWNMPELRWAYGYPLVVGLMAAGAASMLWTFRRWGWIGLARRPRPGANGPAGVAVTSSKPPAPAPP